MTGLIELLPLSVRVDPVFNELHNSVKVYCIIIICFLFLFNAHSCTLSLSLSLSNQRNEDPALRLTVLQALQGAMRVAGGRMSEKHKAEILATLLTLYSTAQVSWG